MKHRILSLVLLAIAVLISVALYYSGNYVIYMLTYIFSFVFLLCGTIYAAPSIPEKILKSIVHALILAAQILLAVLVIRPASITGQFLALYRLMGVLVIFVPFAVYHLWRQSP